jgi:hypothetical protein
MSYQLGVGLEYAYRRYCKDEPPGDYWLRIADQVLTNPPKVLPPRRGVRGTSEPIPIGSRRPRKRSPRET